MNELQRQAALRKQRDMLKRQQDAIEATKGMIALLESQEAGDKRQTNLDLDKTPGKR